MMVLHRVQANVYTIDSYFDLTSIWKRLKFVIIRSVIMDLVFFTLF